MRRVFQINRLRSQYFKSSMEDKGLENFMCTDIEKNTNSYKFKHSILLGTEQMSNY